MGGTGPKDRPRWFGPSGAGALVVSLAVAVVAVSLTTVDRAGAVIEVSPAPAFPPEVVVGDTFLASVGIGNFSTPPESTTFPVLTMTEIDVVPACNNTLPGCAQVDDGVFSLSATGTGIAGPPSCAGTWTITEATPGTFRFTPPGGEGSLELATAQTCAVDFDVTTLRSPDFDLAPGSPGVQTAQVACVSVTGIPAPARTCGTDSTTVLPAQVQLTTSATPGVRLGQSITDTGTVSAPPAPAPQPSGTITFRLFGPDNPTCSGNAIFVSIRPLGAGSPATATSTAFTPASAGAYRWRANYSGDGNYSPTSAPCNDPGEISMVVQLATSATLTARLGEPIRDVATLSGPTYGSPSPHGTITFQAFGPDDTECVTPVFVSVAPVSFFGDYPSGNFTPAVPGTYRWAATYSGDANYPPISAACTEAGELTVVTPASTKIGVFRPETSVWYVQGGSATQFGTAGDIPVPGDYDGDGTEDIAVFRPSTGFWFVQGGPLVQWGAEGDVPVPADYDGNGKTDIAVFRPSNGFWLIHKGPAVQWGAAGDVPVPGDYSVSGDDDIAVFRPSTGTWFVMDGPVAQFGVGSDIPVPADYDGNGMDDIAVFRPSNGLWFVRNGGVVQWGATGDIPVPADYDGMGTDEIAVFRPSGGLWLIREGPVVQFGAAGDDPLPLPPPVLLAYFS